jgi:uncharacterized protein (DUF58 family)
MRLPFSFGRPAPTIAPAAAARGTGDGPLFDEALLARLGRLVLLSGRARATGVAGEHRSRRRGSSPEFADFKSYSQGDDFRRIDWNTYARLDGLFVRLSEVTTELTVHLLLDASDSMDWRGDPAVPTKFTYARRLAGALGYVALWRFDRLTMVPFGETVGHAFGPSQGRSHVVPLLRTLEGLVPLGRTVLAPTIDRYARERRRPGLLYLVSDLLSGEPTELRDLLRSLRARGWQVTVLHVVDEAEIAPAATGRYLEGDQRGSGRPPVELLDAETGERLRLTPSDDLLARYAVAIGAWLEEVESACHDEEAAYVRLLTSWDVGEVVLGLLHRHGVVA